MLIVVESPQIKSRKLKSCPILPVYCRCHKVLLKSTIIDIHTVVNNEDEKEANEEGRAAAAKNNKIKIV